MILTHTCIQQSEKEFQDSDGHAEPYYWLDKKGWFLPMGYGEYSQRIRFCPYCGKDLLTIPTDT